jgi:hypothetical protein
MKRLQIVIILVVFAWGGWEVYGLTSGRKPSVLSATITALPTKSLEQRVGALESRVAALEKNAGTSATGTTKSTETYVALTGGTISDTNWTKIAGSDFTLDTALYGKTVTVTWQGVIDGGAGSVRLYDVTNHRAVDYSDFTTTVGQNTSFYSKTVSIWRGQNQYYIEAKSAAGSITVSSPSLKIVAK